MALGFHTLENACLPLFTILWRGLISLHLFCRLFYNPSVFYSFYTLLGGSWINFLSPQFFYTKAMSLSFHTLREDTLVYFLAKKTLSTLMHSPTNP